MCGPYISPDQLNSHVLHAFKDAPRDTPAIGWIRADCDPYSNELIGAWKLVKSSIPEWNRSTIIKIFSANDFLWHQVDSNGKRNYICGYYELHPYGDMIYEIPRETNLPSIKNQELEYEIDLEGNVLTAKGKRSTGIYIEETFHRLALKDGFNTRTDSDEQP